jgi:hypothetical protein
VDVLTHWFANNIVLSFIIIVVVVMFLTRGIGGPFFGRLVFVLVFAYVVIVLLVSSMKSIEDSWNRYLREDASGFVKWFACHVIGADTACDLLDMAQAKEQGKDRDALCVDKVLAADATDGGAAVKAKCGLRGDVDAWQTCVALESKKYEKLYADLDQCGSYTPSQWSQLAHDVIEPIACPLGIKSWCQTSSNAAPTPPAYVADANYTTCLNDATVRLNIWPKSCYAMPEGQAKDNCYIGTIRGRLPASNAQEWLTYCDARRSVH